jgi:hypothetical protein
VLEQHFSVLDQQRILGTRDRYQQSFRTALAGRRLHGVLNHSVDVTDDDRVFALWRERRISRFVVLQGQWMAVLSRYRKFTEQKSFTVEALHLDVQDAPSWRAAREQSLDVGSICDERRWLSEEGALHFRIGDDRRAPLRFAERRRALVVHGGGWALGDFVEQSQRLSEHFDIELLAGSKETPPIASANVRVHTIPPAWAPWNAPSDRPYPPLIEIGKEMGGGAGANAGTGVGAGPGKCIGTRTGTGAGIDAGIGRRTATGPGIDAGAGTLTGTGVRIDAGTGTRVVTGVGIEPGRGARPGTGARIGGSGIGTDACIGVGLGAGISAATGQENRFHEMSRLCVALVSKPGGSTMLESIATATPIIFLRPCGEHEEANARAWIRRGFGMAMEDWERSNFSIDALERMHRALIDAHERTPDYCERWSEA